MKQKELNIRQRCCMEFINNYDCVIEYHSRRANVVANAFNCKNKLLDTQRDDWDGRELQRLRKIDAKIEITPKDSLLAQLRVKFVLGDRVLEDKKKRYQSW